jgi:plastocyanin
MPLRHRLLAACVLALPAPVVAQTTHVVTVTSNQFSPATLDINVGDTVEWQNDQGCHSVLETTASSPGGFGTEVECAPWTYTFEFSAAGEYTYTCEAHFGSMNGAVTVLPTTAAEGGGEAAFRLDVSPNPFAQEAALRLEVERSQRVRVVVVDLAGREVAVLHDGAAAAGGRLDLAWDPAPDVAAGVYLVRVEGETFRTSRRLTFGR